MDLKEKIEELLADRDLNYAIGEGYISVGCVDVTNQILTLIKEHVKGISPVNEREGMNEYYDDGFKTCVGAILLAIIVALEVNNE